MVQYISKAGWRKLPPPVSCLTEKEPSAYEKKENINLLSSSLPSTCDTLPGHQAASHTLSSPGVSATTLPKPVRRTGGEQCLK